MENQKDHPNAGASGLSAMDAVRKMAAGIAHDLNNILTGILGFTTLMLYDLKEGDPLYALCKEVEKSGNDAKALSDKLMTLSRREKPVKIGHDLAKVVQEAAELSENSMAGRVKVLTDIKSTGLIPVDRDRLLTAIDLVLHKISQYIPAGVDIRLIVDTVKEAGTLKKGVIIVDCGELKIDSGKLSLMSEPCYGTSRDRLLGFEAVVAAEMIADQGGSMSMVPAPFGKGVQFHLELPA